MTTSLLIWWLVVHLFGLVGMPLAAFLFRSLPDRGYAFSSSLGLLLTSYGVWVLAMFGLGSFGVPLVLVVLLALAVLGVLLVRNYWRVPLSPPVLLAHLRALLRQHWRGILAYELLFLAALVAIAYVRAHSVGFVGPHPWGTERPMDLALLNAIRYSSSFPPPDPWLAGYSINYYYFGYLMMAVVAMLSGLEPSTSYNLALALIFALAAKGVAGIVVNLVLLSTRARLAPSNAAPGDDPPGQPEDPPGLASTAWTRRGVALLAVVGVLLAGNQVGALQVLVGDYRIVALDQQQLTDAVVQAIGGSDQITLPYPARTPDNDFGTIATLERDDRLDNFNWWWPSRAVWDAYPDNPDAPITAESTRRYNITEFPFFSFWLGDMHPHVMALPFNVLMMALALATVARPALPQFGAGRAGILEWLLTGVILGSTFVINSWDLPTYLLLYTGALLVLAAHQAGSVAAIAWFRLGKQLGLLLLAMIGLFLPFYLTFYSLVGFAEPLIDLPLLGRLTTMLAPYMAGRTGLHSFLIIFGLFFLPLLAFLLRVWWGSQARPPLPNTTDTDDTPDSPPRARRSPGALLAAPWMALLLLPLGWLLAFPLLFLGGLMIFAFALALRPALPAALRYTLLVLALGCAIIFGTEVVYIRDVFNSRLNTIFKFYYQVWLLWGTVAAFALWWLLAHTRGLGQRVLAGSVAAGVALLLAGALVYPALNVRDALTDGTFIGLEGQTPREQTPAGKAALAWLRENAPAGSVVLEMVGPGGGSYNGEGYAAVSASTGVPTVLGWMGHQVQWRGGHDAARAELAPRQEDVATIYSTGDPDEARTLLERYQVTHIYVGGLERGAYDSASLAKFDQIARPVFQQDDVTIYAYDTAQSPQPVRP